MKSEMDESRDAVWAVCEVWMAWMAWIAGPGTLRREPVLESLEVLWTVEASTSL